MATQLVGVNGYYTNVVFYAPTDSIAADDGADDGQGGEQVVIHSDGSATHTFTADVVTYDYVPMKYAEARVKSAAVFTGIVGTDWRQSWALAANARYSRPRSTISKKRLLGQPKQRLTLLRHSRQKQTQP